MIGSLASRFLCAISAADCCSKCSRYLNWIQRALFPDSSSARKQTYWDRVASASLAAARVF